MFQINILIPTVVQYFDPIYKIKVKIRVIHFAEMKHLTNCKFSLKSFKINKIIWFCNDNISINIGEKKSC